MRTSVSLALLSAASLCAQPACDRACLISVADQYLTAMVAHDASKAPLAKSVKLTENAARLPTSEGLWFTATGLTDYKIYIADPQGGAVGFTGVVEEHAAPPNPPRPAILALRHAHGGAV